MFIFFTYHLIRDIFQDVLNIHSPLIDLLYYCINPSKLPWHLTWLNFGGYRKYSTFPMEIALLLLIPKALKQDDFTKIDWLIIFTSTFFFLAWVLAIPYSTFV